MAVLPLLICLFTGVITTVLSSCLRLQKGVSLLGSVILLITSGWMLFDLLQGQTAFVMQMGAWKAPYGITFYVDLFSVMMIGISAFLAPGVQVYSFGAVSGETGERARHWGFFPLYHFMMAGVVGSFCTSDLFNLYVWFEVLLLGSFGLMALSGGIDSIRSSLKYVILNLFGSAFFLMGLGLLYSSAGTLNFADLILWSTQNESWGLVPLVGSLLIVAFLMKAAAFPFYQWLPASYPSIEISSLAIFSGLLTKVGVYVLIRFFAGGFPMDSENLQWLLGLSAGLTMLLGVWGAAVQMTGTKILSFHIISQIGYILMGVASLSVAGISGAIFYLIHHMVVKTNLFLVMGWIQKNYGHDKLLSLGEMLKRHPLVAGLFAIPALSLAGIPPFSGFWAKLLVIQSALSEDSFWLIGISLFVGVLTFYSMSKIWNEVFLKKASEETVALKVSKGRQALMLAPIFVFCLWTVVMGLLPDTFLSISEMAAEGVLNKKQLQEQVLSSNGGR